MVKRCRVAEDRPFTLFLLTILFALAGCWSSTKSYSVSPSTPLPHPELDFVESMWIKGAGKTAVFCIDGDEESKHRLESTMTTQMKQQGFDAYEGHLQIPSMGKYSAEDLAKLLRKQGFQSIGQVIYPGEVPKDGFSKSLHFQLYSIPDPHSKRYSIVQTALNIALTTFMQTLIAAAAHG